MSEMKPTAYIKRQGNVLTVFIDPATNRLLPFHAWGQEPVGGFPYSATEAELIPRLRADLHIDLSQHHLVYVDPPARHQPHLEYSAEIEREASQQYEKFKAQQAAAPPEYAAILALFRQLPEEDVEAVGSFLISLSPDIEPHLRAARQTPPAPKLRRFKL